MLLAALVLATPADIAIDTGLVLGAVGRYGRDPVPLDPLQLQIVEGRWKTPKEGDILNTFDGKERKWQALKAGQDGWFSGQGLQGGYLNAQVAVERDTVMILEAAGHNMVYVNAGPRGGDVYSYGYSRLPVKLHRGSNDLLFHVSRGRVRAKLVAPRAEAELNPGDLTLPDLVEGEGATLPAGIIVLNNTERALSDLSIRTTVENGPTRETKVWPIGPLTARKVRADVDGAGQKLPPEAKLKFDLVRGSEVLDSATVTIRSRAAHQSYKRTFISKIDGSVQYYGVQPPSSDLSLGAKNLILTLHGASVEATGQADAYAPKPWTAIVAATNRRPYGFDWEDWGRLDALEVLDLATQQFGPQQTYLTGHSMGGHGTWHVGVNNTDRFAAIGPSAGWISFWSYAGGKRYDNPDPVEQILARAASPSDTLTLASNLERVGVYILHGDKDDNVPVTEARAMRDFLKNVVTSFGYHEEPGAGHWWENSDEPGAECVDWPPMFDFFFRHQTAMPETLRTVNFVTANPLISSRRGWAEVLQQEQPLAFSRMTLQFDPLKRRFKGTTANVATLGLHVRSVLNGDEPVQLEIDGQVLKDTPMPALKNWKAPEPPLMLRKVDGKWTASGQGSVNEKGPLNGGPFKNAFANRMVFVYGTIGTHEENAWAYNKARFDAETFWYRGNGSVEVVPDTQARGIGIYQNVILYGNSETNGAWQDMLGSSPLVVGRGRVTVGGRTMKGGDLACLFVSPRRPMTGRISSFSLVSQRRYRSGNVKPAETFQGGGAGMGPMPVPLVGVVSGSGIEGMRLTDRLPYFLSGVAYPDWIVLGKECLMQGSKGVRAAGFFGNDWAFSEANSAFR